MLTRSDVVELDQLIRQGKSHDVARSIEGLAHTEVPRKLKVEVADLARRVGRYNLGLKILNPIIRSKAPLLEPPSSHEKTSYAALLMKLGALAEARKLLQEVDGNDHPEVHFHLGSSFIYEWNHTSSLAHFEKYIGSQLSNHYNGVKGKINLASALLYERKLPPARALLQEVLRQAKENDWMLFYLNAIELSIHLALLDKSLPEARRFLSAARSLTKGREDRYTLFVHKWDAIIRLEEGANKKKSIQFLKKIRKHAIAKDHGETVRFLDMKLGLFLQDPHLCTYVYFGTPYEHFRSYFLRQTEPSLILPDSYLWAIGKGESSHLLDVQSGEADNPSLALKPGQSLHRMLSALVSDFYRRNTLESIFSLSFPNEYFNPFSAPKRISRATQRLRSWFQLNNIPLKILVQDNSFQLIATAPCKIRVVQDSLVLSDKTGSEFLKIEKIYKHWPNENFSVRQAADVLGLGTRSVNLLLKWARTENLISVAGEGRSTKYRFISEKVNNIFRV